MKQKWNITVWALVAIACASCKKESDDVTSPDDNAKVNSSAGTNGSGGPVIDQRSSVEIAQELHTSILAKVELINLDKFLNAKPRPDIKPEGGENEPPSEAELEDEKRKELNSLTKKLRRDLIRADKRDKTQYETALRYYESALVEGKVASLHGESMGAERLESIKRNFKLASEADFDEAIKLGMQIKADMVNNRDKYRVPESPIKPQPESE